MGAVARGEVVCPRHLFPPLFHSIAGRHAIDHGPRDSNPFCLSRRECELLPLVARGWTNKQIARELGIGKRTVDLCVENLLSNLNPGCYQLTGTIAEYSVNIVFEILDK